MKQIDVNCCIPFSISSLFLYLVILTELWYYEFGFIYFYEEALL